VEIKGIWYENVEWISLDQDRDQWTRQTTSEFWKSWQVFNWSAKRLIASYDGSALWTSRSLLNTRCQNPCENH